MTLSPKIREALKALTRVRAFDRVLEKENFPKGSGGPRNPPACLVVARKGAKPRIFWMSCQMDMVIPISVAPGKVTCELKVEEEHTNKLGTIHGGLIATLVDSISSLALEYTERGTGGVSVDMNITYMSPGKLGEEILITAHVLKQGKTLAFASVDLTNKATGKLIAQGRHTQFLGN